MDELDLEARALAWSRYWRSGTRHSCPGSFAEHYGAATQAFWRQCFARTVAEDRTLELGCGNGSLIRFLAEVGEPWPTHIDAVDLADLNRDWIAELPATMQERVSLHSRTAATRVPVGDGTVNRVFSQFALEYFASEACWNELARVFAPRAELAAVLHHRESHLCALARAESQDSLWLLADDGPLDRAIEMLPWLAMSADIQDRLRRDADPRAANARQRFNASFSRVRERIAAAQFPDLLRDTAERVMHVLKAASKIGEQSALQALQALRHDLKDNRLRVAELVECALDREAIEIWIGRLRQLEFTKFEVAEIVEQGYLFGWSLVASRDVN